MGEFILVEHDALKRKKHWDLRFTIPNSKNWISFAMNGLPPTEPGQRVYIVRTTDHSREQALFVGKIPEGEYGAGILKKIEKGSCDIIKYTNAHIIVDFKGHILSGTYHFVNTATFTKSRDYSKKTYAFFKAKKPINESFDLENLLYLIP